MLSQCHTLLRLPEAFRGHRPTKCFCFSTNTHSLIQLPFKDKKKRIIMPEGKMACFVLYECIMLNSASSGRHACTTRHKRHSQIRDASRPCSHTGEFQLLTRLLIWPFPGDQKAWYGKCKINPLGRICICLLHRRHNPLFSLLVLLCSSHTFSRFAFLFFDMLLVRRVQGNLPNLLVAASPCTTKGIISR